VNTTPMAIQIASGQGISNGLTLSAPSGAATGTVDFAINLGSSGLDQSCLAQPGGYPATTGANLSWLRAQYGSSNNCAGVTTYTRDPSGRATFGVFTPETKKAVYTRELY
jgi:MSHA biogenesis protein MshQ